MKTQTSFILNLTPPSFTYCIREWITICHSVSVCPIYFIDIYHDLFSHFLFRLKNLLCLISLHVKLFYKCNCPFPILQHALLRWDRSGTNLLVVFKMSLHLRFIKWQNDVSCVVPLFLFFLIILKIPIPFLEDMHLFIMNLIHSLVTRYCDCLLQYVTASPCIYYPEKSGIKWEHHDFILCHPNHFSVYYIQLIPLQSLWVSSDHIHAVCKLAIFFSLSVCFLHKFSTYVNIPFLIA